MKHAPVRPSIPALAWIAVATWIALALGEEHVWRSVVERGTAVPLWVLAGAVITSAALSMWALMRVLRGRTSDSATRGPALRATREVVDLALIAVGVFAAAYAIGLDHWSNYHRVAQSALSADVLSGVVTHDPMSDRWGRRYVLVRLEGGDGVVARVMLRECDLALGVSDKITIVLGSDRDGGVSDGDRRSHRRREIGPLEPKVTRLAHPSAQGEANYAASVREEVVEMCTSVGGYGGAILQGVLIGDRSRMRGTPVEDDLRVCGLTHLIAVSGSHLAILSFVVSRVFAGLPMGMLVRWTAITLIAAGYVLVSGAQPSAIRSAIMGAVGGAASVGGRRHDAMGALSTAVLVMLVADPTLAFDIGLALSVSAVGGLVMFGSLTASWLEAAAGERCRWLTATVAATVVAQVSTAPIAVSVFDMVSLVSPAANVLATPLVAAGLVLGIVGAVVAFILPPLGIGILHIAGVVLEGVALIAERLARLPGAAVGVDAAAHHAAFAVLILGGVLWFAWPIPQGRRVARLVVGFVSLGLIVAMVGVPRFESPSIVVLDVGQGDAIVVRDEGQTLLVDTGPDPDALRTELTRHGIRRIDVLALTHDHIDHTGGLAGIAGLARVGAVLLPEVSDPEAFTPSMATLNRLGAGERIARVSAGDRFRIGRFEVSVLWPNRPDPALSVNDTSIVLHLERGGFSAVLAGDAEQEALNRIVRAGDAHPIDVLKVPHHGSENGLTERALDSWSPRVALISVGANNDHGHPSPDVIAMLESSGAIVLRTDRVGEITVEVEDGSYRVVSERPAHIRSSRGIMRPVHSVCPSRLKVARTEFACGHAATFEPQACVSDTRPRGVSSLAGCRTTHRPPGGRCRPRLQPHHPRRGPG